MASILGFQENDLQSVLLDESNFSRFETPMPFSKNAKEPLDTKVFSVAPVDTLSDENSNQLNNNGNEKRANAYDYLDYGNYINRTLSQQEITGKPIDINWNFQKTEDKVNVINAILQLLDNKAMFLTLLTQTRDSIERLKRHANESEMKLKSYECNKKKLETDLHLTQMRNQEIEVKLKEETSKLKEQLRTISKSYDHLRYRDKQMEHELRKLEMEKRSLQEKVTALLSNREKKSGERGFGIKVLNGGGNGTENELRLLNGNSSNSNLLFNTNSIDKKNNRNENRLLTGLEQQQLRDEFKQSSERCNMLQSQNANLQTNNSILLQENNELRNSLQSLEMNCRETMERVHNTLKMNGIEVTIDPSRYSKDKVNELKYGMSVDVGKTMIESDIKMSTDGLNELTNQLQQIGLQKKKTNENKTSDNFKEVEHLRQTIVELEKANLEYESLIKTYLNQ